MAYKPANYQRLVSDLMDARTATRESEKLRGRFDPYTLMLAGKERALEGDLDEGRQAEKNTQNQDLKDYAQREANINWCIQQALLTGRCLSNSIEDGGLTGTAQCRAYRNTHTYYGHSHAYSAGLTAWPKTKYPPYSKAFDTRSQYGAPLSPEAALAFVPPFVVEGSTVPAGIGCPFASPSSTAASPGFIANATFTPGTSAAANASGAAAAIAAVRAAANAANLSPKNADILISRMTDAIARSNLNKKPVAKPPTRPTVVKKGLTPLKGR